jgi:hypothetical protein
MEEVARVETRVSIELEAIAVEVVGSVLDHCVQNGP